MKGTRLTTMLALTLPVLLGAGAIHVAVGNTSASAAPKGSPTPPTLDLTVPPAGAKARVPQVDLRPVSITLARTDGNAYWVRVSYQCQSNLPVQIVPLSVKVRPVASRYPDPAELQPARPCGAAQSGEFRCDGTELFEAILDSASAIHETNEGNNTCTFSLASFGSGKQHNCPG